MPLVPGKRQVVRSLFPFAVNVVQWASGGRRQLVNCRPGTSNERDHRV